MIQAIQFRGVASPVGDRRFLPTVSLITPAYDEGKVNDGSTDTTMDELDRAERDFALAVYAARPEIPAYKPVILFGHLIKPRWLVPRMETLRPGAAAVTSTLRCLTCWSAKGADGKCPLGHLG